MKHMYIKLVTRITNASIHTNIKVIHTRSNNAYTISTATNKKIHTQLNDMCSTKTNTNKPT